MSLHDRVRRVASRARPNTGAGLTLGVAVEDAFSTLANERRAHVLKRVCPLDDGEVIELGALAQTVAAWEAGVERASVTADQRKRVYIALYQHHLDNLSEVGAITWDGRDVIARGPETEAFESLLGHAQALQRGEA